MAASMDIRDDSDDLNETLSCYSSSFDEMENNTAHLGTEPYLFEPEIDSDEEDLERNTPDETNQSDRLGTNEWCSCGHCPEMATVTESICCHEIPEVMTVLHEDAGKTCITLHQGFEPVCLNQYVLRTAYFEYRQQYQDLPESNDRMRYIGYRQLVRWCWGWLGRNVRVPLPACAVTKVRETYPEETGTYHGFDAPQLR
ncbi:P2X purinoceptor 7-like [Saccostrea echinata]|uniref:P2X purinoceptor 7-like n=1 Tax=Saccostrea echinata TaxID=191078 RepID=UPI002A834863|nr:P2X purinoceptor 7-like [Saccostrea echinata]